MSQKVKAISEERIPELLRSIGEKGRRVIAPVDDDGVVVFQALGPDPKLRLDVLRARKSIKEFFFPMTETLFKFQHGEEGTELRPGVPDATETVIWGCRPCDAAALSLLDRVFGDEVRDEAYFARRAGTTVVTAACEEPDEYCFCTSVGGSPVSEEASDLILRRRADGRFQAKALSEKGEALLEEFGAFFEEANSDPAPTPDVAARFDPGQIKARVDSPGFFDSVVWDEVGRPCLGCGTCAFVCPTCHCFDIVDEGGLADGRRVKNWDSCGFGLFTKEAAGHNPRATQPARYRQRVMHKLSYVPARYGLLGCVGCGRCSVRCPAGVDVASVVDVLGRAEVPE